MAALCCVLHCGVQSVNVPHAVCCVLWFESPNCTVCWPLPEWSHAIQAQRPHSRSFVLRSALCHAVLQAEKLQAEGATEEEVKTVTNFSRLAWEECLQVGSNLIIIQAGIQFVNDL